MQPKLPDLKYALDPPPQALEALLIQRTINLLFAKPILYIGVEISCYAVIVALNPPPGSHMKGQICKWAVGDAATAGTVHDAGRFVGLLGAGYVGS